MNQPNPYGAYTPASPPTYPASSAPWMAPHRSGTVLTLGILSLVLCQLTGPFAWAMGANDLRLINAGTMDPTGRGTIQAGMVCGIIGTCLLIVWAVLLFLQLAIGVAIFGAAAAGHSVPVGP